MWKLNGQIGLIFDLSRWSLITEPPLWPPRMVVPRQLQSVAGGRAATRAADIRHCLPEIAARASRRVACCNTRATAWTAPQTRCETARWATRTAPGSKLLSWKNELLSINVFSLFFLYYLYLIPFYTLYSWAYYMWQI